MNPVMSPLFVVPTRVFASVLCAVSTWAIAAVALSPRASAQSLPSCPPAMTGEYLLLVNDPSPEDRDRLGQVLPTGATVIQCDYQGATVVQVGNFADEELARSWAEYLSTVEGFQTAIAPPQSPSPPEATPVVDPTIPDQSPAQEPSQSNETANSPTYKPTALGSGYAVLVRYFDRPELATQLQSQLNAAVGLAVYEQQPYLLALYSSDAATAGRVLQGLSEQFSVVMVDSRQVIVLSPAVSMVEPVEESANSQ